LIPIPNAKYLLIRIIISNIPSACQIIDNLTCPRGIRRTIFRTIFTQICYFYEKVASKNKFGLWSRKFFIKNYQKMHSCKLPSNFWPNWMIFENLSDLIGLNIVREIVMPNTIRWYEIAGSFLRICFLDNWSSKQICTTKNYWFLQLCKMKMANLWPFDFFSTQK
jgi:hypothetical protein